MLHNGNKIFGHPRSEENIKLIRAHLETLAEDGDSDALVCRFCELLLRIEDQEISHGATFNHLLKCVASNKRFEESNWLNAQVLIYQPELTHSVWVDYEHRKRSHKSLEAALKKAVKDGEYIGYRFVTIHKEELGVQKPRFY